MFAKTPNSETCDRCPHRFRAEGCPAWIRPQSGFVETNIVTGEERIVTGCFYEVLPRLLQHVIRASNRPAASFDALRSEVAQGMVHLAQAITHGPPPIMIEGPSDGRKE